jgi:hypothetical protein
MASQLALTLPRYPMRVNSDLTEAVESSIARTSCTFWISLAPAQTPEAIIHCGKRAPSSLGITVSVRNISGRYYTYLVQFTTPTG